MSLPKRSALDLVAGPWADARQDCKPRAAQPLATAAAIMARRVMPSSVFITVPPGRRSVQLHRLLPVLVELLELGLGVLERLHHFLDPVGVAVQVAAGEQSFQLGDL